MEALPFYYVYFDSRINQYAGFKSTERNLLDTYGAEGHYIFAAFASAMYAQLYINRENKSHRAAQ